MQPESPADPTTRFSGRADFYARWRPTYPPQLLEFFVNDLGITPQKTIADIGAGTGLLTELLLESGATVFAVEPNADMRGKAEAKLKTAPNFKSLGSTAEATGLPAHSVNLITAAQAFHWFDRIKARAEFARILAPGGWVALVWNERRSTPNSFGADYTALLREFRTDPTASRHEALTAGDRRPLIDFFAPAGFSVARFDNHQTLDRQGVIGRFLSMSSVPLAGEPRHAEAIGRLNELFDRHQTGAAGIGETVKIEYDTQVYYGHLQV